MSQGVLYIAFGDNFLKELTLSAESVKRFCPDLHITVFSDKPVESEFIDECRIIEVNHLRPKIDYIMHAPYERTLFLDTDTIIDYDISDMFDILDNFDIALAHDLARKRKKYSDTIPEYGEIPYSFSGRSNRTGIPYTFSPTIHISLSMFFLYCEIISFFKSKYLSCNCS